MRNRRASAVAILWLLLGAASYRSVLADLFRQWQSNPSYSHGWLVVPIASWILWSRRDTRPALSRPWPPGLALVLTAQLLLVIGDVYFLPGLQRWTLPAWSAGFIGVVFGRGILCWSLPAILFTCFMIPLPFQAEQLANLALQSASAWTSCCILSVLQIFAATDGHSLILENDHVGITDACSGLRMTTSLAALSFLLAILSCRGWRRRVAFLVFAVPTALAANAVRICAFAYAIHHWDVSRLSTWAHDAGDWLMVPLAAALLMTAVAWARCCWQAWGDLGRAIGRRGEIQKHILHGAATTVPGRVPASLHRLLGRAVARRKALAPRSLDAVQTPRRMRLHSVFGRLAVGLSPLALVLVGVVSVQHYITLRATERKAWLQQALAHEAQNDWRAAVDCYDGYLRFAPGVFTARRDRAVALERLARTNRERVESLQRYAALLRESPYDAKLLERHLHLALSLDAAGPALSSAKRLNALGSQDATVRQGVLEARLRFAPSAAGASAVDVEAIARLLAEIADTPLCRDEFVTAAALHCCQFPDHVSPALRQILDRRLPRSADRLDSAEGYYARWLYGRTFNLGWANDDDLQVALHRSVAGRSSEAFVAAAREARTRQDPEAALQLLQLARCSSGADAAVLSELGDLCRLQNQPEQAARAYAAGFRASRRENLVLGFKLAETLGTLHREDLAMQLLDELDARLGRLAPVTAAHSRLRDDLLLLRARLEMRSGHFDGALAALHAVETSFSAGDDPAAEFTAHETARRLRARCLVSMRRYTEAATLLERMARAGTASGEMLIAAGRAWRAAGEDARARSCYCRAVNSSAALGDGWLEYVGFLVSTGKVAEATSEIAWRERRLATSDTPPHQLIAQGWEMVGQAERAEPHYRTAAEQDPNQLPALAIHLARRGQIDAAVRLIADSRATLSPARSAHTLAVVGLLAASMPHETEEAIEEIIRDGLAQASNDSEMLIAAANWYSARGEPGRAAKLLDRVVESAPDNLVAANNRAMLLAEDPQQCAKALKAIDSVLLRAGPAVEFLDTRGWILLRMNRPREAAEQFERAIAERSAADPLPHFHLAAAYLEIGDQHRAHDQWRVAQQLHLNPRTLNNSERRVYESLQRTLARGESRGLR